MRLMPVLLRKGKMSPDTGRGTFVAGHDRAQHRSHPPADHGKDLRICVSQEGRVATQEHLAHGDSEKKKQGTSVNNTRHDIGDA